MKDVRNYFCAIFTQHRIDMKTSHDNLVAKHDFPEFGPYMSLCQTRVLPLIVKNNNNNNNNNEKNILLPVPA
jgi:hypothetical protein